MIEKALRFSLQAAYESGAKEHPQIVMRELGLDNYYRAEPHSIGDCWFFFFKEWPAMELPSFLHKVEIDYSPRDVKVDTEGTIFYPGDKIRHKQTGAIYLVEYDYATAFWGTDHNSLSLCALDKDGNIIHSWAWASAVDYELVDSKNRESNMAKMREYNKRHDSLPHYISKDMARKIHGWEG